ncbi:Pentatricopeptide repeat-containing protein [Glycine soja]
MQMQVPVGGRVPTWFSRRRLLEEKLCDLHKCTNLDSVNQIHAQVLKANLHQDLFVAPKLIAAFSLCRHLASAVNVFNHVPHPNVHLYNSIIRAHAHNSSHRSLPFNAFFQMQKNGLFPDNFTYPFLLKACSGPSSLPLVRMIHAHVEKIGFYGDIFVPNSLIDSYSRCGNAGLDGAMSLFLAMEERDVVTWNSMIGGLVRCGELQGACKLFDEMPDRDMVSWNTMLDGYAKAGEMDTAFELFERMPWRNIVSWSTMVCGYSKGGDMDMARMLFDRCPVKNVVLWTTIIAGYAEKGLAREATELYGKMEEAGMRPDDGFLLSILAACAESGMLGLGKRIHASMRRWRFRCGAKVLNAFIDMYAKCGCLDAAFDVFSGMMAKKDVVSWNSMIQGFAMHGHGEKALELFSWMVQEGFEPDTYTFVGLLCACTHAGLVNEGRKYFYSMEKVYGIVPQVEHYGCMMDLLGRGGHLKEAFMLLRSMPMEPNAIILGTLLNACRMHNDVDLARAVCEQLFKLEPSDPGNYSLLSNIYAQAGDWMNVANVRLQMKNTGGEKPSGASSIEVEEEVHEFTVFDQSHPKSDDIYQMIDRLVQDLRQCIAGLLKTSKQIIVFITTTGLATKLYAWLMAEPMLLVQASQYGSQKLCLQHGNESLCWFGDPNFVRIYMSSKDYNIDEQAKNKVVCMAEPMHLLQASSAFLLTLAGALLLNLIPHLYTFHQTLVTSFHFTTYLHLQGTQLTWKHVFSPTIPSPKPLINSSPQSETGCHMSSPSPFDDDEKSTLSGDWRSFRAKLVAGEQLTRPVEEVSFSSVNDLDIVVDHPPLITIGDKWAHVIHEPEKGCILIATEKLDGVHIFERTVILLLSTGPLGPSGIILNRPSLMSIKETRSTALDVEGTFSNSPLFFGGPLEEGLFLLSPKEGGGGDGVGKSGVFEEVMKGLYYGAKESVGCAAEMVKRNVIGLGDFRFFDGYCGWEKEQLRDEIRAGYWTVAACSPSVVGLGSVGSVGLWDEVLGLMSRRKLLRSRTLAKLKTREKKFKPVAEHVNAVHRLLDPASLPFKWSWRDVSIKYLGVKQKICLSLHHFNWKDDNNHWENFLKYKEGEEVGFDGGAEGGGGEARGEVAGEGVPPEEVGYLTTPIILIQCALVLLSQRDNLPKGGVYPPGIIFGPTDLQERLQQNGISFDVISESTISS